MKALLCKEFGPPDKLVVEEIPSPSPADGEVLIRVRACGVNYPDNLLIAGKYQVKPPLPFSPGMELAGEIIETGTGVSDLRPGQRVAATPLVGGMAEQVCVPARAVVPIPDNMPFETAAGFVITYGTSCHALVQRAQLDAGEKLLVLGAGGGVGLTAVEIGTLKGAEVFAAASTQEKLALAKERGAKHLIDYSQRSLKDQIKEMTGGQGVDVIYDPVGGDLFDDCLRSIAWRGRILVVGFASGEIPKIPANLTLLKGSSVVGVFWGAFAEREPAANRDNLQTLLAWYGSGKLNPCIAASYALADAPKAMQALLERRAAGKLVVTI